MVEGNWLIVIFFAALLSLFLLILYLKWDPFISLLVVGAVTGLVAGIPVSEVPVILTGGFGETLAGVGIIIGLGIILGQLMENSGAIHKIAKIILNLSGPKRSSEAIAGTGLIAGIPLFFDAAFVILSNMIRSISFQGKVPYISLVVPLAVGLITAYTLVVPTPAPLAVAANLELDLGLFFIYGLIVAVPAIYVGGVLYGKFLGVRNPNIASVSDAVKSDIREEGSNGAISVGRSFFVILLPISLILLNTLTNILIPDSTIATIFEFVGDGSIALLISVIVAAIVLKPYMREDLGATYRQAFKSSGLIIMITGAGGAFGSIINETGIGDHLISTMQGWEMPALLLAFVFAQMLRISLGSSTVSLVTTSTILAPTIISLGASPILVGLAIAAGGIGLSMPNDSGFWVISRFTGLSVVDTLKSWSMGGFIAGVTGLVIVYILSLGTGFLPGI